MRLDKWLKVSRLIKRRTVAQEACDGGRVSLNGRTAKPSAEVKPGDIVVAKENFGCGSSREQAPAVLKALGVKAVLANSFARIFYRNSINIGLPVIVCKDIHGAVKDGDELELSLTEGVARVNGKEYACTKLPENLQKILDQGGLIASLDKED